MSFGLESLNYVRVLNAVYTIKYFFVELIPTGNSISNGTASVSQSRRVIISSLLLYTWGSFSTCLLFFSRSLTLQHRQKEEKETKCMENVSFSFCAIPVFSHLNRTWKHHTRRYYNPPTEIMEDFLFLFQPPHSLLLTAPFVYFLYLTVTPSTRFLDIQLTDQNLIPL